MHDISKLEEFLKEDGILFLSYGGLFTQTLVVGMTEALEKEVEENGVSPKIAHNIFVVFIELAQNLMNYSKKANAEGFDPRGLIIVGKDSSGYYVLSQNVIDKKDREKIETKLEKIKNATKEEIKKLYKEARRSGKDTHAKGGGIGFYEIAKRVEKIDYEFVPLNDEKVIFRFKAIVGRD